MNIDATLWIDGTEAVKISPHPDMAAARIGDYNIMARNHGKRLNGPAARRDDLEMIHAFGAKIVDAAAAALLALRREEEASQIPAATPHAAGAAGAPPVSPSGRRPPQQPSEGEERQ